jgi:cytochrome c biogenesis protein CcdA
MGSVRPLNLVDKKALIVGIASLLAVLGLIPACFAVSDATVGATPAPNFEAFDLDGNPIELGDFDGEALILHITNIETPLCIECEEALKAQVEELQRLKEESPGTEIVTINVRKNPYSKDGRLLAESWWGADISWPWIEDFDPFPVSGKYIDYWSRGSGFANPTIIIVDDQGQISRVYHVYQIGEGMVEGVQTAETLEMAVSDLENSDDGRPAGFVGPATAREVTFIGMFGLGIVTSLAPCSLALLIAVFSYLMTSHRRKILMPDEGKSSPKEGLLIGVAFTLGMAMVFFVIGLFISNLGIFVRDSRFFDLAAGVLMIILGITSFKPLNEILEPLTSRLHRQREELHGAVHKHLRRPLQVLGFRGGLHPGSLLRPGLGTLCSISGISGPDLADGSERLSDHWRFDALCLRRGARRSHHTHIHLLSHLLRSRWREVHRVRKVDYGRFRDFDHSNGRGLCGQVLRIHLLVSFGSKPFWTRIRSSSFLKTTKIHNEDLEGCVWNLGDDQNVSRALFIKRNKW